MSSSDQHTSGKRLGQGMLIVAFAVALFGLAFYFDGLLDNQANPNQSPASYVTQTGVREVILERNRQGHYVSGGYINGIAVTFLLDTGATDVAIPASLAARAGLKAGRETLASTANGVVKVYSTQIDELRLGNIRLRNIAASLTPSMGGDTILLGMSALQKLDFSQRGSTLTLRQLPES